MKSIILAGLVAASFALLPSLGRAVFDPDAGREVSAVRVSEAPSVDGKAEDSCWAEAPEFVTRDPLAGIDIRLRAVYTDESIYLLAVFPDATENRSHKAMRWSAEKNAYETGPDREDTFVVKWNMEPFPVDLTIDSDEAYKADIWYWKAHRTDPAGYADDKYQLHDATPMAEATAVLSRSGRPFHLFRSGDGGSAAYQVLVYDTYEGDRVPKYRIQAPRGSRADVRARGAWHQGVWTVEFGRSLDTGQGDDLSLAPGGRYLFGVSRYEIAGRKPDPGIEEPLFGAGDVSEPLWLVFR